MKADEYVKKVVGFHITKGRARNQLYKIVYKTNHDRVIRCQNKKVKYSTKKAVFIAEEGKWISRVNQKENARVCCGKIVNITQEDLKLDLETELNNEFAATCSATQYLSVVD
jgi:hypothetical protein